MSTWVPPTVAIALVVIAFAFAVMAVTLALTAGKAAVEARELARTISAFQKSLSPILENVHGVTAAGHEVAALVRREAEGFADASRRVRVTADEALKRVEEKLANLEALYDTLYTELEGAALDLGAAVSEARRPEGWIGRVKRVIGK